MKVDCLRGSCCENCDQDKILGDYIKKFTSLHRIVWLGGVLVQLEASQADCGNENMVDMRELFYIRPPTLASTRLRRCPRPLTFPPLTKAVITALSSRLQNLAD